MVVIEKHADLIDFERLKELLELQEYPSVTIYSPTHAKGPEVQQDPIRLKNLLKEVEAELVDAGMRPTEARSMLAEARDLVEDKDFWVYQRETLALFISSHHSAYYRLPLRIESRAVVDRIFHVLPILPAITPDTKFHILALNQNHIRLLEGTRYTIQEVDLEKVPTSLREFLADTQVMRSLQFHTGPAPSADPGRRGALFHGQGVQDEKNEKKRALHFFQRLDQAIKEFISDGNDRLVMAGQPHIQALYREASRSNHLLNEGVDSNPDDLKDEELHNRAWNIVSATMEESKKKAMERFHELAGNDRSKAENRLKVVIPAAYYKGVGVLFVPVDKVQWGLFNPDTNEVQLHLNHERNATDLFNFCAANTIRFGGDVFAVPSEEIPGNGELAAILR